MTRKQRAAVEDKAGVMAQSVYGKLTRRGMNCNLARFVVMAVMVDRMETGFQRNGWKPENRAR